MSEQLNAETINGVDDSETTGNDIEPTKFMSNNAEAINTTEPNENNAESLNSTEPNENNAEAINTTEPNENNAEAEAIEPPKTSLQITIDKPLLTNLAQSLHVNLIITTNSYIQILQKLNELGQSSVQEIIPQLTNIQEELVQMLSNVQNQLGIEPEKREDPQKIIQNASNSDAITKNMLIVQSLFTALATISPLLLGGKGKKRRKRSKKTKRKITNFGKHKTTKKSSSTNI